MLARDNTECPQDEETEDRQLAEGTCVQGGSIQAQVSAEPEGRLARTAGRR